MNTLTIKANNAKEYKLLEAGILSTIMFPIRNFKREKLYDDKDNFRRFDAVELQHPTLKNKSVTFKHTLTDSVRPGYVKRLHLQDYQIEAVQHMYRVHVVLPELKEAKTEKS